MAWYQTMNDINSIPLTMCIVFKVDLSLRGVALRGVETRTRLCACIHPDGIFE